MSEAQIYNLADRRSRQDISFGAVAAPNEGEASIHSLAAWRIKVASERPYGDMSDDFPPPADDSGIDVLALPVGEIATASSLDEPTDSSGAQIITFPSSVSFALEQTRQSDIERAIKLERRTAMLVRCYIDSVLMPIEPNATGERIFDGRSQVIFAQTQGLNTFRIIKQPAGNLETPREALSEVFEVRQSPDSPDGYAVTYVRQDPDTRQMVREPANAVDLYMELAQAGGSISHKPLLSMETDPPGEIFKFVK